MVKELITIILSNDTDGCKGFMRVDTGQMIDRGDFVVLQELPVLYLKPKDVVPQPGVYAHYFSEDFNEIPAGVNAILLSKRKMISGNMEIYAGQYCQLF